MVMISFNVRELNRIASINDRFEMKQTVHSIISFFKVTDDINNAAVI